MLISTFAGAVLSALVWIEEAARYTMSSAGLHGDLQTLVLVVVVATFLLGVSRLMSGRIRASLVVVLMLMLAHVCSSVAHGAIAG
jgi:hypothetical protein